MTRHRSENVRDEVIDVRDAAGADGDVADELDDLDRAAHHKPDERCPQPGRCAQEEWRQDAEWHEERHVERQSNHVLRTTMLLSTERDDPEVHGTEQIVSIHTIGDCGFQSPSQNITWKTYNIQVAGKRGGDTVIRRNPVTGDRFAAGICDYIRTIALEYCLPGITGAGDW